MIAARLGTAVLLAALAVSLGTVTTEGLAMTSTPPEPDPTEPVPAPVPAPPKPKKDETARPYHETN